MQYNFCDENSISINGIYRNYRFCFIEKHAMIVRFEITAPFTYRVHVSRYVLPL